LGLSQAEQRDQTIRPPEQEEGRSLLPYPTLLYSGEGTHHETSVPEDNEKDDVHDFPPFFWQQPQLVCRGKFGLSRIFAAVIVLLMELTIIYTVKGAMNLKTISSSRRD
jgi:hypothetical protein